MSIQISKNISKEIIEKGEFGEKPSENSTCVIIITDISKSFQDIPSNYLKKSEELKLIIGDTDTGFDRLLERLLQTMFKCELCKAKINVNSQEISFNVKLVNFIFDGFLFEWLADKKYDLALKHKNIGVELFKQNRHIDAFYRFSKAIKLLMTCVVEVDDYDAEDIDGIKLSNINEMKINLFNNLASCHLKLSHYDDVIVLCNKVIEQDENNVKAIYKRGIAYCSVRDLDNAEQDLLKFLNFEPNHRVAKTKLVWVKEELAKSHKKFVSICENMFRL